MNQSTEQDPNRDARAALQLKIDHLIKELREIQTRTDTMNEHQRERYVSISKRLVDLQEKIRSPLSL